MTSEIIIQSAFDTRLFVGIPSNSLNSPNITWVVTNPDTIPPAKWRYSSSQILSTSGYKAICVNNYVFGDWNARGDEIVLVPAQGGTHMIRHKKSGRVFTIPENVGDQLTFEPEMNFDSEPYFRQLFYIR